MELYLKQSIHLGNTLKMAPTFLRISLRNHFAAFSQINDQAASKKNKKEELLPKLIL